MAPVQKAINEWRPILTAGKIKLATGDPARELRRLIWEPLEPHLDGVASVLVSPDGPIGMIPLAALPGKEPESYLIEERSIAVVPVPRVLGSTSPARLSQRTDPGKAEPASSLLLAGDINYGGDAGVRTDRGASRSAAVGTRAGFLPNFPRLPATGDEIASIGRDFRKRSAAPRSWSSTASRPPRKPCAGKRPASVPPPGDPRLLRPRRTPIGTGAG